MIINCCVQISQTYLYNKIELNIMIFTQSVFQKHAFHFVHLSSPLCFIFVLLCSSQLYAHVFPMVMNCFTGYTNMTCVMVVLWLIWPQPATTMCLSSCNFTHIIPELHISSIFSSVSLSLNHSPITTTAPSEGFWTGLMGPVAAQQQRFGGRSVCIMQAEVR